MTDEYRDIVDRRLLGRLGAGLDAEAVRQTGEGW